MIKGTIDDQGNLQIEVVATANVVAQIGAITGLEGGALDSFLGGVFDGQTISQELAVQIKAMGLANASMGEFEATLEGQLAGINGKTYDVQLNADGTVNIVVAKPEVPNTSNRSSSNSSYNRRGRSTGSRCNGQRNASRNERTFG